MVVVAGVVVAMVLAVKAATVAKAAQCILRAALLAGEGVVARTAAALPSVTMEEGLPRRPR